MIQVFQDYLTQRGISWSFFNEERTLLTFDIGNIHFFYSYQHDVDPVYIRMMIPNIGNATPQAIQELLDLSQTYKVGKAIIVNQQVWLSVDAFIYSRENVNRLFNRLIDVLTDMFNEYRRTHNG